MNNEENKYISVTALNRYISYKFDMDVNLQEVYLKGELSNFKYSNRHAYFSLKDETSEIQGMFFYPNNQYLDFTPTDGMSVLVIGQIKTYQKKGTYAIIVKKMEKVGIGKIYQDFLALKDTLEKEGLFSEERKLKIPEFPECVAVVTAITGEAINDIISTFNRRLPLARIRIYPSLVQGVDAPKDLIRAVLEVYRDNWADLLIIGRGGGSYEDLACFNDEALARLLAKSKIPVISAVGHEGDFTICDFVASYRAPTPTGAAMRATKDKNEVIKMLADKVIRLKSAMKQTLSNKFYAYDKLMKSYSLANFDTFLDTFTHRYKLLNEKLIRLNPEVVINNKCELLNNLTYQLDVFIRHYLENTKNTLDNLNKRLSLKLILDKINLYEEKLNKLIEKSILLNPFNVMLKGYTLTYQNDTLIKSVLDIDSSEPLKILYHDGCVYTSVTEIKKEK